jgi:hypothetical protein
LNRFSSTTSSWSWIGFLVHRARGLEGKDGNPLNEVRMLCDSILQKDGVMTADKTIKFDPAKSVLRLQPGDGKCRATTLQWQ